MPVHHVWERKFTAKQLGRGLKGLVERASSVSKRL